jgi:hypothetical protein
MTQRSGADTDRDASPASPASPSQKPGSSSASVVAAEVVAGTANVSPEQYIRQLSDESVKESAALQAARVVEELANQKPELLAPHIEALIGALRSTRPRVAQAAAHCLPVLARVVPAKVAKHLKTLQSSFSSASDVGKDGLVRTFVALCVASVTYQKRLIENFEQALRSADSKQLAGWVEHILPALKGEPYAQARTIAEKRLSDPELPRPIAQRVADLLSVKLRSLPDKK